jgi:hypothetical protein
MMATKLKDGYGSEFERIKMMVTIVPRGEGEHVIKELRSLGVTYNLDGLAYGAVGLRLTDVLGFTEEDCDIVYSIVTESKVRAAMSMIEYKFSLDEPHSGISFCVPISGVGGPLSLKYISGTNRKGRRQTRSEGE